MSVSGDHFWARFVLHAVSPSCIWSFSALFQPLSSSRANLTATADLAIFTFPFLFPYSEPTRYPGRALAAVAWPASFSLFRRPDKDRCRCRWLAALSRAPFPFLLLPAVASVDRSVCGFSGSPRVSGCGTWTRSSGSGWSLPVKHGAGSAG